MTTPQAITPEFIDAQRAQYRRAKLERLGARLMKRLTQKFTHQTVVDALCASTDGRTAFIHVDFTTPCGYTYGEIWESIAEQGQKYMASVVGLDNYVCTVHNYRDYRLKVTIMPRAGRNPALAGGPRAGLLDRDRTDITGVVRIDR